MASTLYGEDESLTVGGAGAPAQLEPPKSWLQRTYGSIGEKLEATLASRYGCADGLTGWPRARRR